ncbi:uncharacterized protein IL334_004583 [Kwoniella shivajii]|uniref:Peroxisomal ATPase PEX1 n=1 Tax=Kwoniella shivajii TaxID=564305 RepID=A0ABZ1D3Q9_9TREE|nr:hypothetical protein IL334_004583 [Kwoniella shivajii]
MARKAAVKYRSLRSNLVHLPLSLFAQLAQQQARPQSLILHLLPLSPSSSSSRQPKPAYLGWSGLAASSSLSQAGNGLESIEIDPEVALSLGWTEGTLVEISVIHNPTKALSVSVTPLTSDDWEILEQHASFLETHLLSQLRAAQKGQEIDVWVAGKTKIRIRVDETSPSPSIKDAVLVNIDTEVYVAPRPRGMAHTKTVNSDNTVIQNEKVNGIKKTDKGMKIRLIPPRIASGWGALSLPPKVAGDKVVLCSPGTLKTIKRRLKLDSDVLDVIVTSIGENDRGEKADRSIPVPVGDGPDQENTVRESHAQLVGWQEMPDGCMTVLGGTEEWESNWGKVRVKVGQGKRKGGKSKVASALPETLPTSVLPGTKQTIDDAVTFLSRPKSSGSNRPLLILGNKGSGKTTVVKQIAEQLERERTTLTETLYEDVGKLDPGGRLGTIKETISGWIENAQSRAPCCLILDGLDILLGPESELNSSSNPAILVDHFCRLFSGCNLPSGVLVLITSTSSTSLHPILNSKHLFGGTMKIPPLTKEVRQDVIRFIVETRNPLGYPQVVDGYSEERLDYVSLGGSTEGYSIADLVDLVGNATQQSIIRSTKSENTAQLVMEDFVLAQESFTPLSLRGVSLQKSDTQWSDIGGLHEPRSVLRETLEWPTKYAQIFASCPLRLRSGLLLYGYPGCGKTLLASAVARECGLNFISVKGPEILNKYIGASEKAVRDLFERATGAKPCVLFFDEFDSVAPKRGHDSTGVTDRVVNQLLTEMDGAQGLSGVYVLAATSRPDLIDPALLRPGRLDKSILCDMPSSNDRREILQSIAKNLNLSANVNWEELAEKTEGMSGADLQAVVYNAHLEVIHSTLDDRKPDNQETGKAMANGVETQAKDKYKQLVPDGEPGSAAIRAEMSDRIEVMTKNNSRRITDSIEDNRRKETVKPLITHEHLMRSLTSTRPSVPIADRRRLQSIYRSFVNERDGKMGNGDLGRGTGTRVSLM